jgi:S-adenosylmethionine:tRNA ribosyltransferase-isomerase
MRTDLFDFELPEDRIALRPATPRDSARLLVVRAGEPAVLADRAVRDLPDLLRPGDAVVVNDTKVLPASLRGRRVGRGEHEPAIAVTLVKRLDGARWRALVKPAKRLVAGDEVRFGSGGGACLLDRLDARVEAKGEGDDGGAVTLAFAIDGVVLDQALAERGAMPLPPYIASRRAEDERDMVDYQTIYAREDGSVAAPTAGLHFTPQLMEALEARGVSRHFVTLHVGAGTFLPVKTEDVAQHRMHAETGEISSQTAQALNAARARGGRIVAIGTTALRLLESAVDDHGAIRPFAGETSIFITPGYEFRTAVGLVTNFHLPRSTLFMLVSAFCGLETMRAAYAHAIAAGYRFYSYGDASLLWRA